MSNLVSRAFLLASDLHASQTRKQSVYPCGPKAPYLSHLMEVTGMVQACGVSDMVVAAALLHDAVEDQGMSAADLIVEQCGPDVLALVMECTEQGTGGTVKAPWKVRKDAYLAHLSTVSSRVLLISVADKLQSLRELWHAVRRDGDAAYLPFVKEASEERRKLLVLWFQQAFLNAARERCLEIGRGEHPDPLLHGIKMLLQDFNEVLSMMY